MRYFFLLLLVCVIGNTFAQSVPDTGGMSPIKTMSYSQYKAYIDGADQFNLAVVAEINNYPNAQKVIDLKKELDLSADQLAQVTAINSELHRKMKEMGDNVIHNERALDELFRTKKINDGNLIFYTNRYGLYQGEMRNAVLQAAVKVEDILTPSQLKKYQQLLKLKH
jgi:Spy/CpxP family protein refolding chaperone